MSIQILKITEVTADRVKAKVKHVSSEFEAWIVVPREKVSSLETGKTLAVELEHLGITSWRLLPDFQDEDSAIIGASDEKSIKIVGRIHNIVDEGAPAVLDIYLMNGPEFITVTSEELGGSTPPQGSGIELIVKGLTCWPTWSEQFDEKV